MSTVDETPQITAGQNGTGAQEEAQEVLDAPGSKNAWLTGPSDLEEDTVSLPDGRTVRVRGLTAGQQGQISEQCTTLRGQKITVDQTRIKVLTFMHGVVEPKFDEHEANQIAHKFGHDFELVVGVVNAMSGATEEDVERARRRFRPRR